MEHRLSYHSVQHSLALFYVSSDKTNISAMMGNCIAHPSLISLTNIAMDFWMKLSNHIFLLLALLPIPWSTHPNKSMHRTSKNWLIHECLNIVSDPLSNSQHCFTPLATYIVDTPESALLAGIAGKTSSVTMAMYKHFGNNFWHEPHTASRTLAQLQAIEAKIEPWELKSYVKEAKSQCFCRVHWLFWAGWLMSDPVKVGVGGA